MRMGKSLYSIFYTGCLLAEAALQVACVNVNEPLKSGYLPLQEALENRDAAVVKRLLAAGADPNLMNPEKPRMQQSLMQVAMENGKGEMECVQALLDAGAKIGTEEVMYAAYWRYPQYLRAMLDAGGEVPRVEGTSRQAPIWNELSGYGADKEGKDTVACAKLLMERGYSPHDPAYSRHPLHSAAKKGNEQLVRFLLDQGFSPNEADEYGNTPLMENNESEAIAKILLEAGAKVNAQNRNGCTPLMQTCMQEAVVRVLLKAGALPNLRNKKGETALLFHIHHPDPTGGAFTDKHGHYVTWHGDKQNIPVIKALIEKGADVKKPDTTGETPLQAATNYGSKELLVLLLNAGAKR